MESFHGPFNGDPPPPASLAAGDPNSFNLEQRNAFDRVLNHYLQGRERQLLPHVDGVARTGASRVTDLISKHLTYHAAQLQQRNLGMRGASTGVAAHTIQGSTLHQLPSLPVKKNFEDLNEDLNEERVSRLQDQFRRCWLLIIDEKSIVEAQIQIDCRQRRIKCNLDDCFGGLNVLFLRRFGTASPARRPCSLQYFF